jgi:diacylglycerol O-acyltransferase-1
MDMPPNSTLTQRKPTETKANGNGHAHTNRSTKRGKDTKYRHVFATHAVSRTSCLSQDSEETPSFMGFRNLMILVLIVSNLRLMIVNLQKVLSLTLIM